jgi:predicted RNA-binding protein YlqC (UPF0109 family)
VSSFDDEFGLFSESAVEEVERQPSRRISPQPPNTPQAPASQPAARPSRPYPRRERRPSRPSNDPWAGHRRASELLGFLARKLVANPEEVSVELFVDERSQPVIELVVHPDDLGKVIGRSGRVAHALRTIVRATAEGRVAVDILDTEEAAEDVEDGPSTAPRQARDDTGQAEDDS